MLTDAVTPAQLAAIYEAEADDIQAHCADHSRGNTPVWLDCHCAVADRLRRKATAARQQPTEATPR